MYNDKNNNLPQISKINVHIIVIPHSQQVQGLAYIKDARTAFSSVSVSKTSLTKQKTSLTAWKNHSTQKQATN